MSFARTSFPGKVLARSVAEESTGAEIALLENRPAIRGLATAYVCRNYTCMQPVTSAAAFEEQLGLVQSAGRQD